MTILKNPILALLPELVQPSVKRPDDEDDSRTWESLGSLVLVIEQLMKLGEWHKEVVGTNARKYAHNLRRRPVALIQTLPPDKSGFIYAPGGIEAWDKDTITLQSSAKSLTVEFWIV